MKPEVVKFTCNICGVRSPQPILCTREECPTEYTVRCAASPRKQ